VNKKISAALHARKKVTALKRDYLIVDGPQDFTPPIKPMSMRRTLIVAGLLAAAHIFILIDGIFGAHDLYAALGGMLLLLWITSGLTGTYVMVTGRPSWLRLRGRAQGTALWLGSPGFVFGALVFYLG
jgi:hypothetical protein